MDWLPAFTTTSIFAVVLWLGKNLIATRLKKSVEHEFNEKLERIRRDLRASEELLKAELRARENEITSLRGGVLNAMSARHVALDKRRLEAVEEVWSAVVSLAPAKIISSMMAVINFEAAANETAINEKARRVFDMLGSGFDPKKLMGVDATKARPFVSPIVWALYCAYSAIVSQAVVKLLILQSGIPSKIIDREKVAKLIKTALPDHSSYVDQFGDSGYHHLLDELEQRLLTEINRMLTGKESDQASLDQAAAILKQSNEVVASLKVNDTSK